jgi:hypothetical protein
MRYRSAMLLVTAALGFWGVLRAQRPFKQYQAAEYGDFPLPPDWDKKPSGLAHGFAIPASTAPAGESTSTGRLIIRVQTVICSRACAG